MKSLFPTFAALWFSFCSFAQVGVGTTSPEGMLDINNTESGIIIPRVSNVNQVLNPKNGMFVYDMETRCGRVYENDSWSDCTTSPSKQSTQVISDCNSNGFEGKYLINSTLNTGQAFSVTITNNSFTDAQLTFNTSDLTVSGAGSSISVTGVSHSTETLVPDSSLTVTYSLGGTTATEELTAEWSNHSMSCSKKQSLEIGSADFNLPYTHTIATYDNGGYKNITGYINNSSASNGHQIILNIPYTNGEGPYAAYNGLTENVLASSLPASHGDGETGDNFYLTYPTGTFSGDGTIPVTVVVAGGGQFNIKLLNPGERQTIVSIPFYINGENEGNIIIEAVAPILDKYYGDGEHDFAYLTITDPRGNVWLNNNLGADYANYNLPTVFNPAQQAQAHSGNPVYQDYHAYGSLFQWGRDADGHELINWTNATSGTPKYGLTNIQSDDPNHNNFIYSHTNWRENPDPYLWTGGYLGINRYGINPPDSPCPPGFMVIDVQTFEALNARGYPEYYTNLIVSATTNLPVAASGYREYTTGNLIDTGVLGSFWTNSPINTEKSYTFFFTISSAFKSATRDSDWVKFTTASANPVRCLSVNYIF